MKKLLLIFFLLSLAACGPKMPKDQYDEVYKTKDKGYPEYLLMKKINDSTYSYMFFPEDYEMTCAAQKKGTAINQFYHRGPDIVIQKDGSGIPTYRYAGDNYKCTLVITTGFPNMVKVHSHCNGGDMCPQDAEYVLEK
ncbi:MAG TPA: hypothetical protein VNB90_09980 [Cytophagaceae bacterium]|jgi:hypothetical protein|nr:hypothetical protein [Cytophagaceae bacterium]